MSPPDGGAQLKVISYFSQSIVDEAVLRNFTNVDSSQELELNERGEFTGYQHSYREGARTISNGGLPAELPF